MRATATTGTTTATATLAVPLRPLLDPVVDFPAPTSLEGDALGELTALPVPELGLLIAEEGAAVRVVFTVVAGCSELTVTTGPAADGEVDGSGAGA